MASLDIDPRSCRRNSCTLPLRELKGSERLQTPRKTSDSCPWNRKIVARLMTKMAMQERADKRNAVMAVHHRSRRATCACGCQHAWCGTYFPISLMVTKPHSRRSEEAENESTESTAKASVAKRKGEPTLASMINSTDSDSDDNCLPTLSRAPLLIAHSRSEA